MDFDLQRGLHDLSAAPSIPPDALPTERVLTRVHRERALRAAATGAVGLAVVVGAAVAVVALPRDPAPPVDSPPPTPEVTTTTPSPAPTPSETPTTSPTPDPPAEPPLVALTNAGEIVLLDPQTGATLQTVMSGLSTEDPAKIALTVAPDRTTAYVSNIVDRPTGSEREIVRVSLDGSSSEVIAEGMQPAISPDGATLAYVGRDPARPGSEEPGLILLDIATGTSRFISSGLDASGAGWIDQPAWSRDGSRLYVPLGYEGSELQAVEATATTFADAVSLGDDIGEKEPVVLADGTVLVACGYSYSGLDDTYVAAIDPTTGAATERLAPVAGRHIVDMAAHPTAQGVAFLAVTTTPEGMEQPTWDLYRWDEGGEPRLLGTGFVAVAW